MTKYRSYYANEYLGWKFEQEAGQKKVRLEVSWPEREELPVPHRNQIVSINQAFIDLIHVYHGSSIHPHKYVRERTQIYHKSKSKKIIQEK